MSALSEQEEFEFRLRAEREAQQAQPRSAIDKIQGSSVGGVIQGARDPIDQAAAMLPKGLQAVTSLGGNYPNRVSQFFGDEAARVQQMNQQGEQEYQKQRAASGREGFDAARLTGNIISPVNAAIAAKLPAALGAVKTGIASGTIGGALADGGDVTSDSYWKDKAVQAGVGGLAGGVFSKVIKTAADKLARRFRPDQLANVKANMEVDGAVSESLKEAGIDAATIPENQIAAIRQSVLDGLKVGKKLDAAAAVRKADFDQLGINPLQGQITRDPLQFAQERNLRGAVPEVSQRLAQQGQQLRDKVSGIADGADDAYGSGSRLIEALQAKDNALRTNVSGLYKQARESAGRELDVPLQGLSQDYAQIIKDFGIENIPSGVRNHMDDYGLLTGKQNKIFTVEEADKLLKVINQNTSNNPAVNTALGRIRNAVKASVMQADDGGGVFAPAVKAASERFKMHDAIPALKQVAEGNATPDKFVSQFVVNGKADEVKRLAEVLKNSSPEAYKEARGQIGATLRRAALGENPVGDAPFTPERYAKALRDIGKEKLSAFFDAGEIDDLNRIARVGAYINKIPDVAPVNTSNTFVSAAMNSPLLNMIPGKGALVGAAKAATGAVKNQMATTKAMNPKIPFKASELTPEQRRLYSLIIGGTSAGAGIAAGDAVK